MIFKQTKFDGLYEIHPTLLSDERGDFFRAHCSAEFSKMGLRSSFVQSSIATNILKGTVRGLHFQKSPHEETKLIRCIRGAVYDVVIDLRPDSKSYKQWACFELSSTNRIALYVPKGFAHGYQTLENDTELLYQMAEPFVSEAAGGIRFDDPIFGVKWPLPIAQISLKDRSYPNFI